MVRDWPWWQLPPLLRWYVATPIAAWVAVAVILVMHTDWRSSDLLLFALLAGCGSISSASTPRIAYTTGGGLTRDFSSIWVLPTAILLPPIYALVVPIPFMAVMQLLVHRGVVYRRVFTAAATGLSYAAASWVFHSIPASFAGPHVGSGTHAFTWCLAVVACEILGSRAHHFLIFAAVKMADPSVRILKLDLNREALQGLFVEVDLGVLITLAVGLSPALVLIAMPTVLLVRRFLVFPLLVAQSRVDSKTGLLNVSTWEAEAEVELSRARRTQSPLAMALVDIDHFKTVNDTYGHLVGDKVLKSVAQALTSHLRDYDRAGRFGGEEFVLLLAQTSENDACRIAERLRSHIAGLEVPVNDRPNAPTVSLTISIGVTAMEPGETRELTDLLAAADSALYHAKQTGRNRIAVHAAQSNMGLDAEFGGHPTGDVRVDPTGASLRLLMLLCVSIMARHEAAIASAQTDARAACRPPTAAPRELPEAADEARIRRAGWSQP
jgi:diguanylate cyclase (GGDEF)-like protein